MRRRRDLEIRSVRTAVTGGRGAPLRHGMPGEPLGCRSITGRAGDLDISGRDLLKYAVPALPNIRLGRMKAARTRLGE